jgi:hypothetical protein
LDEDAVVEVECQVWGFLCHGFCGCHIVDCDYCDGYKDVFIAGLHIKYSIEGKLVEEEGGQVKRLCWTLLVMV